MDAAYDCKFEEMKKYIPFLESMIKRLESTATSQARNPRQAQLDKIRSLRDLLLDERKRMKMENLLKCEQVLINLYAKVEQKETLPGIKAASNLTFTSQEKIDLSSVRTKLKNVAIKAKLQDTLPETLPEIARASETEVVCTPGSKEPALFQRRPKQSISPSKETPSTSDKSSPQKSVPKRNYTRILVSPDRSHRRWTTSDDVPTDKPLYSRRSPKKSPRRSTPSYLKKERRKSSALSVKKKSKDLNITLNVPEESLNSLNTEDILSRIINCNDSDVDIHTLRDLRSQILGELNQAGDNKDLTDLILKSYKKKKTKQKQEVEVEEGELSDSESEAIESIYGSLVLVDKDKNSSNEVKIASKDKEKQPRKIQICLVINSDKGLEDKKKHQQHSSSLEILDLEMYNDKENSKNREGKAINDEPKSKTVEKEPKVKSVSVNVRQNQDTSIAIKKQGQGSMASSSVSEVITIDDDDEDKRSNVGIQEEKSKIDSNAIITIHRSAESTQPDKQNICKDDSSNVNENIPFKLNFYKPLNEQDCEHPVKINQQADETKQAGETKTERINKQPGVRTEETVINDNIINEPHLKEYTSSATGDIVAKNTQDLIITNVHDPRDDVEIPLLNLDPVVPVPSTKTDGVSEIDILQALKNEILSESIAIPIAETSTPLLHLPKVTKVASSQELRRKNRISIEKYKEKSVSSPKSIFVNEPKEDYANRKQSLKLTEKECERFNFSKFALDDSSDEEEITLSKDNPDRLSSAELDDIYDNLAPKSPEFEEASDVSNTPIIIPIDPVKATAVASITDVDMRQTVPTPSPILSKEIQPPVINKESLLEQREKQHDKNVYKPPYVDPRLKWELNKSGIESPNTYGINSDRTPISTNYPNMTPNRTPNARTYDMTPSHQSFEIDDHANRKHVYAPSFIGFDTRDRRDASSIRENNVMNDTDGRRIRWEVNDSRDVSQSRKWPDRDPRNSSQRDNSKDYQKYRYNDSSDKYHDNRNERRIIDKREDYSYGRLDCPRTPNHPFGRSDCPSTPNPSFGRLDSPRIPFGRSDCPPTPSHSFGRSDCPSTPSHPFGRSDCPSTPSHPFGRSDCPSTPSHPFGRTECPSTPSHPFGRSDCPSTPSHPFGRSECPSTPNHPFGRSDCTSTSSHPFGRNESTHLYGRSDTPSHPFGRSESNAGSMTPNHPFGRSDYSLNKNNSSGKYVNDPRLKRASDYEKRDDRDRYYKDRRDIDGPNRSYINSDSYGHYGRDHSRGEKVYERSGRAYDREQPSRREPSVSRSINRDYESETPYAKSQDRSNNDYPYDVESNKYGSSIGPRRNYNRAPSVGRRTSFEDKLPPLSPRGSSGRRSFQTDNTLSVKPQSGRSFIIDTSVNTTFQEFLNNKGIQVFDYSFDVRRQRAASVGRSLHHETSIRTVRESSMGRTVRELSVGRTLPKSSQTMNNRNNFTRARSVGRDMIEYNQNRSFKDVKADFEAYKSNTKEQVSISVSNKQSNYRDPRSRKSIFEKHQETKKLEASNAKSAYSARKNVRDPRFRKELQSDAKGNYRYDDRTRDRNNYGIVYSSDNIAKGTVLGAASGVKNYKIPKIKRVIEEPEQNKSMQHKSESITAADCQENKKTAADCEENKKEKKCDKIDNDTKTEKVKKSDKDKKQVESAMKENTKISIDVKILNRATRSHTKKETVESKFLEYETAIKTRRSKRNITSDSDSDSVITSKEQIERDDVKTYKPLPVLKSPSPLESNKEEDDLLESSFGIDDLEIPDNINALIADLDNDIDDQKIDKNDHFSKEITLENLFDSIKRSEEKEMSVEDSLNELSELINTDLHENKSETNLQIPDKFLNSEGQPLKQPNKLQNHPECSKLETVESPLNIGSHNLNTSDISSQILNNDNLKDSIFKSKKNGSSCEALQELGKSKQISEDTGNTIENQSNNDRTKTDDGIYSSVQSDNILSKSSLDKKESNDAIVSTTDSEKEFTENIESEKAIVDHMDRSTPDSTINATELMQLKGDQGDLPDSTNEMQKEMHSDISSTHDSLQKSIASVSEQSSSQPQLEATLRIDPLENLLSILQDKSKIKELLSMLDEKSADNEKIKKKLEKLSEIVSDDDDDTNQVATLNTQGNSGAKVENESQKGKNQENISKPENSDSVVDHLLHKENQEDINTQGHSNTLVENELPPKDTSVADKLESLQDTSKSDVNINLGEMCKPQIAQDDTNDTKEKGILQHGEETDEELKKNVKVDKPRTKNPHKKSKKNKGIARKKVPIKRITRADTANKNKSRTSRELKQLQDDIKEMFLSDDVLNATGIRMCRLAKFVDDKVSNVVDDKVSNAVDDSMIAGSKPIVVLEKFKNKDLLDSALAVPEKIKKRAAPKSKIKVINIGTLEEKAKTLKPSPKYKPGPKSKTRRSDSDASSNPYEFELDSISETSKKKNTENSNQTSSDSENESIASSKSFDSSEVLADLKKRPKRKRPGWKAGVIKSKKKKKKVEPKLNEILASEDILVPPRKFTTPDLNCFTDKSYCFLKNTFKYPCRLCNYEGIEIVHHYKLRHPHSEIPLSRMEASVAKEAISQCEEVNFQAISNISTMKYVCRFCFKEFHGKRLSVSLEPFFWHVVSAHTGEYKQLCSECINVTRCPFNLDIPPPPKNVKGQLIGYICGKCNFTQISLENLKTHVIVRHNDEQTEVYTVNLAVMTKKTISYLNRQSEKLVEEPRVLRSRRSNQSATEVSDDRSDITESTDRLSEVDTIQPKSINTSESFQGQPPKTNTMSKISFESEDSISLSDDVANTEKSLKVEADYNEVQSFGDALDQTDNSDSEQLTDTETYRKTSPGDIVDYPHFQIKFTDAGVKEYVCCINRNDSHYRTTLVISMKRHVKTKHFEKWDGYCSICKVIVMPQGQHHFKECLEHLLDRHIDNFPILQTTNEGNSKSTTNVPPAVNPSLSKSVDNAPSYINVRPLSELQNKQDEPSSLQDKTVTFPVIESVVSLGVSDVEPPISRSNNEYSATPVSVNKGQTEKIDQNSSTESTIIYKYEEVQLEIMDRKQRVVLDAMKSPDKLVKIFKCAGRFCYFTTDSTENALLHASTHQRIGGQNALACSYCNYDCLGNAIDLVTHVFKSHGCCQFVCGHCFYRAVASQLVRAHILRVHGQNSQLTILKTTHMSANVETTGMLSREIAVPYFICAEDGGNCKYKTYTHSKFYEHVTLKHKPPFTCHYCAQSLPDINSTAEHLKTSHGLKLFQCTWCVHGANNEAELLAHASANHPNRQPQAYLRVISTKDNSTKMMVLPLVQYNKSLEPTVTVTPSADIENPVQIAEKSIDLENLIVSVVSFSAVNNNTGDKDQEIFTEEETRQVIETEVSTNLSPRPMTSLLNNSEQDLSERNTPVLKSEPASETPEKAASNSDVVYCLDSDDDNSRQNVVDISENKSNEIMKSGGVDEKTRKIPLQLLFICPNPSCNGHFKKYAMFRKHMIKKCYQKDIVMKCYHCPLVLKDRDSLFTHYLSDHYTIRETLTRNLTGVSNEVIKKFICEVCSYRGVSLADTKQHLKTEHNAANFVVMSINNNDGQVEYIVKASLKKPASKRKLSNNSPEKQSKKTRYGPNEVDKLPSKPILDDLAYCALCEFSSKVRLNVVRHLQRHAEKQPVPQTVPVNPVPHLETNEMHFDKMTNLASSSIVTRLEKSARVENVPTVSMNIPPEAASRYPKYVPERQRHACGAKGCSYISVDEAMLKCHWETLHAGTNDFHCVHCPPYQHLDTSRPLTAARVLAHLKMHDVQLYSCSLCAYYHYKRQVLEKHLIDVHKGSGQVKVVREEASTAQPGQPQPAVAAPTMDLKPWQCGLCKFKNMLRQEVVEHCAKTHSSKMQYKCPCCPFRTSAIENVTKHQANSHPDNKEDVIYYYYREGSIPDDYDGTPRWVKQGKKMGITEAEVKAEMPDTTLPTAVSEPPLTLPKTVDLNLVKQEVPDADVEESIEDLCMKFGQFCEPNGLRYKCPLCKVVVEDTKESMQSHLFEELKYRKWGCSICSYKAFHKTGLSDHMQSEHHQNREPIMLPIDNNVEKWVAHLLQHQTTLIEKMRQNFDKQKIVMEKRAMPSTSNAAQKQTNSVKEISRAELEQAFGEFGDADGLEFCCPKCSFKVKEESAMHDHLESELNRIRWRCSNCNVKYQEYHEAQLHCKSIHPGQSARPVEALRDPAIRASWVASVIRTQKQSMNLTESPSKSDNSENKTIPPTLENPLLVVRFEENIPTPELEALAKKSHTPTPAANPDSDDERLVIDESDDNSTQSKSDITAPGTTKCPVCNFVTRYKKYLKDHMLRHYDLKPETCTLCGYNCYAQQVGAHLVMHPGESYPFVKTKIPDGPPTVLVVRKGKPFGSINQKKVEDKLTKTLTKVASKAKEDDDNILICLVCERSMPEIEIVNHEHDNIETYFAKKGKVIVKCCNCLALFLTVAKMQEHHEAQHSQLRMNYAYYKLHYDTREIHCCGHCNQRFKFIRDLKTHHNATHGSQVLSYTTIPFCVEQNDQSRDQDMKLATKRKMPESSLIKRVAKKSTTKSPFKTVAKKSTTKLPIELESDNDDDEDYTYYGTKPASIDDLDSVTTVMPFCNTMMSFSVKKLSEIIKIDPKVVIEDVNK